jgi:hypothetical protein
MKGLKMEAKRTDYGMNDQLAVDEAIDEAIIKLWKELNLTEEAFAKLMYFAGLRPRYERLDMEGV